MDGWTGGWVEEWVVTGLRVGGWTMGDTGIDQRKLNNEKHAHENKRWRGIFGFLLPCQRKHPTCLN